MKNLTVPQLKKITHDLSREVLASVRSNVGATCDRIVGLEKKDEIPLSMDVITECYVDALSDMAYLATGAEVAVKALMLKNHKEVYARILRVYNIKAEARASAEPNKSRIIKPNKTILRGV